MPWFSERAERISPERLTELMERTVEEARRRLCPRPKRVLLLPPDITRAHSGAGLLTQTLYGLLQREADVHVLPSLGQHVAHTAEENRRMFGAIPADRIHEHDWRNGCVCLGEVPAEFVREATGGVADWPIPITLDRRLVDERWDWIINIGQVVPHESLGFAGHNKNYFIGLAGQETICAAHMAASCMGVERNMGTVVTGVRACFNKAEDDYLAHLPDLFVQLVHGSKRGEGRGEKGEEAGLAAPPSPFPLLPSPFPLLPSPIACTGLYVGDDRETYLEAARQSRQQNITLLDEPLERVVCFMRADEYQSTWVANKAIYRTRMAIADGGELLVIAPGLKRFGESPEVDALIRKYGYVGTPRILEQYRGDPELRRFAHAAAHLMDGSPEGRFSVTYAQCGLSRDEIEGVGFRYADLEATLAAYQTEKLRDGFNDLSDGRRIFFLSAPASGLWATRTRFR